MVSPSLCEPRSLMIVSLTALLPPGPSCLGPSGKRTSTLLAGAIVATMSCSLSEMVFSSSCLFAPFCPSPILSAMLATASLTSLPAFFLK